MLAQPRIHFDTNFYDVGKIIEGSYFKKEIKFTNTGNQPLIINNASTSDGGFYAEYPKAPIEPGKSSAIVCHYDTRGKEGTFHKSITISSTAREGYCYISVKGHVIWPPTKIHAIAIEQNFGTLPFGEIDTVTFDIVNIGDQKLYIDFFKDNHHVSDILYYSIYFKNDRDKYKYRCEESFYEPGDTIRIVFIVKNVYGNTGLFKKPLYVCYNSLDTLKLTLKGEFIGQPYRNVLIDHGVTWIYENEQLVKKHYYSSNGLFVQEDLFKENECIRSTYFCGYHNRILFYQNGLLIKIEEIGIEKKRKY